MRTIRPHRTQDCCVRYEGALLNSRAYRKTLRKASDYAAAHHWAVSAIRGPAADGLEIRFDPKSQPIRLVFDSKFRIRGEAYATGAKSRADLLQLFDVLDPYFRLLVLEERRESTAGNIANA